MPRLILLAMVALPVGLAAQNTVSNTPPSVQILTPTNGSRFQAPAQITVMANAIDRDGDEVVEVSFFANQRYIGGVTNPPPTLSPLPPWRIQWENAVTGPFSLQARATDARGAFAWSPAVRVDFFGIAEPPRLPVVNIIANDPEASEGTSTGWPTTGSFLLTRSGSTAHPMTVFLHVSGTAANGLDCRSISNEVTIPAGASFTHLPVFPIDDREIEPTETVIVRVEPIVCPTVFPPPPGCYEVGSNHTATVFIYDGSRGSNAPPVVRIISPTSGSRFPAGAPIRVCADASDHTRYVDTVEFFAGDRSLGVVTNDPFSLAPYVPYCVVWSNAPAGEHILTAKATDNFGLIAISERVLIAVGQVDPPPTNRIFLTIEAPDSVATEQDPRLDIPSDPALLLVRRHGPTNVALQVYYRVAGTAANGVDYARLTGELNMPAGARTAEIMIDAIDDNLVEGTETVVVTLQEPACIAIHPPPPECYLVGRPGSATAYIRDNDSRPPSNSPPAVRITAPTDGARFAAGSDIRIDAVTVDRDGYAPRAEFFANGRKIGEQEIHFIQAPPDGTPIEFSFVWNNVEAGSYTLTVKGTDDDGAMAFSAPVGIRFETNRPPPPPTNVVITLSAIDSYAVEGGGTNSTSRGTNTASFLVRRSGPTNNAVTVRYHVGGTASNGVDYAALPGEITIPAGARTARILVVPMEDRLVEGIETVVLELASAGGDPPSYSVGQPRRAAAIIVDNDSPRPPCRRLDGGLFHICMPGRDGDSYRIEASCNLIDWVPLCSNVVIDGAIHFVDPDVEALPYRFYRTVPGTPGEE